MAYCSDEGKGFDADTWCWSYETFFLPNCSRGLIS